MWIFEKGNAVGVLGQIPLLAEITSRISNYARDIPCFTKIYIAILRDICGFKSIYVFPVKPKIIQISWDICCLTKIYFIILKLHRFLIKQLWGSIDIWAALVALKCHRVQSIVRVIKTPQKFQMSNVKNPTKWQKLYWQRRRLRQRKL